MKASRIIAVALLGSIVFGVTYCSQVPFDAARTASVHDDVQQSGDIVEVSHRLAEDFDGQSAYYPLVNGNDALGARLRLIERADSTIDAQYFMMKPDHAGSIFAAELIDAADRGVRVRFLLDDVFTTVPDDQLAYIDAHENIELRLLNPLSRRTIKPLNFLFDFSRVNRRMHNKSLTVDGAISIIGGRNIADEYFQINTDAEFADFDLIAVGPAADEIGEAFDLFWNDPLTVPMSALAIYTDEDDLEDAEVEIEEAAEIAIEAIYLKAISSTYIARIEAGEVAPMIAPSRLVTDIPDKLRTPVHRSPRLVADEMRAQMAASQSEVLIFTPYMVPREEDVDFYAELEARGVDVRVVTNSLASTNHAYVHGGYAQWRKPMLRSGVELFEIRADAPQVLGQVPIDSDIKLTMHTKVASFDRQRMFAGSYNFDPRSVEINTEIGLFLNAPEVAEGFTREIEEDLHDYTFAVTLDSDDNLVWTYTGQGQHEVFTSEPGATLWERFQAGVTRILPIKGQL